MKKFSFSKGFETATIEFCPPHICPICGAGIANEVSYKDVVQDDHNRLVQFCTVTLCHACKSFFLTRYEKSPADHVYYPKISYPRKSKKTAFSKYISETFPMFVNIYNQSEIAESEGLSDICGTGYRKAVEFLVKDYLILQGLKNVKKNSTDPLDPNNIKCTPLSKCINQIENENIRNLAIKSAWLGNDATHYVKIYQNRDVSDMKKFISAMVMFIEFELLIEESL